MNEFHEGLEGRALKNECLVALRQHVNLLVYSRISQNLLSVCINRLRLSLTLLSFGTCLPGRNSYSRLRYSP